MTWRHYFAAVAVIVVAFAATGCTCSRVCRTSASPCCAPPPPCCPGAAVPAAPVQAFAAPAAPAPVQAFAAPAPPCNGS